MIDYHHEFGAKYPEAVNILESASEKLWGIPVISGNDYEYIRRVMYYADDGHRLFELDEQSHDRHTNYLKKIWYGGSWIRNKTIPPPVPYCFHTEEAWLKEIEITNKQPVYSRSNRLLMPQFLDGDGKIQNCEEVGYSGKIIYMQQYPRTGLVKFRGIYHVTTPQIVAFTPSNDGLDCFDATYLFPWSAIGRMKDPPETTSIIVRPLRLDRPEALLQTEQLDLLFVDSIPEGESDGSRYVWEP